MQSDLILLKKSFSSYRSLGSFQTMNGEIEPLSERCICVCVLSQIKIIFLQCGAFRQDCAVVNWYLEGLTQVAALKLRVKEDCFIGYSIQLNVAFNLKDPFKRRTIHNDWVLADVDL